MKLTNICLVNIFGPVSEKSIRNDEEIEFEEETSFRWGVVRREPCYPGKFHNGKH